MTTHSSSLRRHHRLPHSVCRHAPADGTAGLRNPASREHVRVRGNQVFGERFCATTGNTTSSSDDEFLNNDAFFPDLNDFLGNLNMGDNTDAANAAADAAAASANAAPYVILSILFQFLLEFLGLAFVVDAIGISCLHAIYSST